MMRVFGHIAMTPVRDRTEKSKAFYTFSKELLHCPVHFIANQFSDRIYGILQSREF